MAYAYLLSQFVESFSLHNFAACVGKKAFALAFKVSEHDVAHDGVENGVAQKFKTLVVYGPSLFVALGYALVEQCLFVQADVVRIKTDNVE